MAQVQKKKRFSLFVGSPPQSPPLSPASHKPLYGEETQEEQQLDRQNARKAVESLERLVATAETYRDLVAQLGKTSRQLSKALKEYGACKGTEQTHAMCFQTTSQFYENYADVQAKLGKITQKDFDELSKFWAKYSRKVEKDEKAHDTYISDLDKQVKKTGKDYEKKSKKDSKASVDSHEKYIQTLSALGSEIARARKEYGIDIAKREKRTRSIVSQLVCRLTDAQFASFNDSLKKSGPSVAKMKEWAPFAAENMPPPQELDDFLDDDYQPQTETSSSTSGKASTRESLSSISEKQVAAMNYKSPNSTTALPEESSLSFPLPPTRSSDLVPSQSGQRPDRSDVARTMQNPAPSTRTQSNDSITNASPVTPSSGASKSSSPTSERDESTSPTSPILPMASLGRPTANLISRFSIGIHADDHPFMRDEAEEKVREAEVIPKVVTVERQRQVTTTSDASRAPTANSYQDVNQEENGSKSGGEEVREEREDNPKAEPKWSVTHHKQESKRYLSSPTPSDDDECAQSESDTNNADEDHKNEIGDAGDANDVPQDEAAQRDEARRLEEIAYNFAKELATATGFKSLHDEEENLPKKDNGKKRSLLSKGASLLTRTPWTHDSSQTDVQSTSQVVPRSPPSTPKSSSQPTSRLLPVQPSTVKSSPPLRNTDPPSSRNVAPRSGSAQTNGQAGESKPDSLKVHGSIHDDENKSDPPPAQDVQEHVSTKNDQQTACQHDPDERLGIKAQTAHDVLHDEGHGSVNRLSSRDVYSTFRDDGAGVGTGFGEDLSTRGNSIRPTYRDDNHVGQSTSNCRDLASIARRDDGRGDYFDQPETFPRYGDERHDHSPHLFDGNDYGDGTFPTPSLHNPEDSVDRYSDDSEYQVYSHHRPAPHAHGQHQFGYGMHDRDDPMVSSSMHRHTLPAQTFYSPYSHRGYDDMPRSIVSKQGHGSSVANIKQQLFAKQDSRALSPKSNDFPKHRRGLVNDRMSQFGSDRHPGAMTGFRGDDYRYCDDSPTYASHNSGYANAPRYAPPGPTQPRSHEYHGNRHLPENLLAANHRCQCTACQQVQELPS